MHADFGKIAVYTYYSEAQEYDPKELIAFNRASGVNWATVNNMGNTDWLNNNVNNGYQFVHSQLISSIPNLEAITSTTYGIKSIEGGTIYDKQRLVFTI